MVYRTYFLGRDRVCGLPCRLKNPLKPKTQNFFPKTQVFSHDSWYWFKLSYITFDDSLESTCVGTHEKDTSDQDRDE